MNKNQTGWNLLSRHSFLPFSRRHKERVQHTDALGQHGDLQTMLVLNFKDKEINFILFVAIIIR